MRFVNRTATCWLWTGRTDSDGYGKFWVRSTNSNGRTIRAHRFIYEHTFGPIDNKLVVMHTCDTPSCVRIDHLKIGTYQANTQDAIQKGRWTTLRGAEAARAKLTAANVEAIRRDHVPHSRTHSAAKLAQKYHVNERTIWSVLRGESHSKPSTRLH
jgi:hypothetical protein